MTNGVLELNDSRRLTGPNLFGISPGAVIDVEIRNINPDEIISIWKKKAAMLLNKTGWNNETTSFRKYDGGASLVITAPIDCLYAATEVNEAAWNLTTKQYQGEDTENLDEIILSLINEIECEQNPHLIEIYKAAIKHQVVFLSDDDQVSLGYGASCKVFPIDKLPSVNSINWNAISDIPVALITGTNGKSTTVRLASAVIKAAGKCCGITSTDYIRVGDQILDKGDYSGPGGARMLLRHPNTEVAFLEVARGGMLRRGVGINHATAALITNVSEDHLGEYGINHLDDMVEAKFIVRQTITNNQNLILNADDSGSVKFAEILDNKIVWFSWNHDNSVIQSHINSGGDACYVRDNQIYWNCSGKEQFVEHVKNIPITLNGAAKHNVHNALAVTALTLSLGVSLEHIRTGLKNFINSPEENPGRGNLFEIDNFKVILDFAHNEHGLSLMAETINNMEANRRLVMLGQAGDRNESLIEGLVKSALKANPNILLICELPGYLRGRDLGVTPNLIHKFAIKHGLHENQIIHADNMIEGTKIALDWAQAGDLMLLLGLDDREAIFSMLKDKQA